MEERTAVVLLSGGLDSSTILAVAKSEGYGCHCVSFDYGQKNRIELDLARRLAERHNATHQTIAIDVAAFGDSAMVSDAVAVPKNNSGTGIPSTYVPARNMIFLAYGVAVAEVRRAAAIFIGVNSVDYSGYPDCRPEFIAAFQHLAGLATKAGTEGAPVQIRAPLQHLDKSGIIKWGTSLGVDYSQTLTCYDPVGPEGLACGECDSCRLRRDGFVKAGIPDPTRYCK